MSVPEKRGAARQLVSGMAGRPQPRTTLPTRGIIETGEHVLLGECAQSGKSFSALAGTGDARAAGSRAEGAPCVMTARYRAMSMYASRAPLPDDPVSVDMDVAYTSLSSWLGQNRARMDRGDDSSLSITVDVPEDHEARISDDLSPRIGRATAVENDLLKRDALAAGRCGSVGIVASSPRPPSWFYGHARTFGSFLTMATKLPVHAEAFVTAHAGHDVGVFPACIRRTGPECDSSMPDMYFDYPMPRGTFDETVTSWFELAKKYRAAMDLYFALRLGSPPPPKMRFLAYVQALEALFRARHPGGNASLREMLNALIDESYEQFGTPQERGDFVSAVADTHSSISRGLLDGPRGLASEPNDFCRAVEGADVLIYGCILGELDADDKLKGDIFRRKKAHTDSMRFIGSLWPARRRARAPESGPAGGAGLAGAVGRVRRRGLAGFLIGARCARTKKARRRAKFSLHA